MISWSSSNCSSLSPGCAQMRAALHCLICFLRYIHIIMVFWSFLAGVVTFYCSLGPESLLPNILVSIKPKVKVGKSTSSDIECI